MPHALKIMTRLGRLGAKLSREVRDLGKFCRLFGAGRSFGRRLRPRLWPYQHDAGRQRQSFAKTHALARAFAVSRACCCDVRDMVEERLGIHWNSNSARLYVNSYKAFALLRGAVMRFLRASVLTVTALFLGPMVVQAADIPVSHSDPFSGYELRISALSHNIEPGGDEHGGIDLGGSIVFPKVSTGLAGVSSIWIPRVHIGGTGNLAGKTSFAYAGVTWSLPIMQDYFFSFDFGGALNNGEPNGVPQERVAMGCNATFRESASIGRSIAKNMTIAATVEHFSNANLCDHNSGITNVGLMVGYRF